MSSAYRHSQHKKQHTNTRDHAVFALVVLLAAVVYTRYAEVQHYEHDVKETVTMIAVLVLMLFCLGLLRRQAVQRSHRITSGATIERMSGVVFERYAATLLTRRGYKRVRLTEYYDLGIDIIAEKDNLVWGIQVKRYSEPVPIAAVRQTVAALQHYGCDRAMIITNSNFSTPGRRLANSNGCRLVDGNALRHW